MKPSKRQSGELGKRTEVAENRRRSLTVGPLFARFVATILSAIPCNEPELAYSAISHTAVAVDAVAKLEGITAVIALFAVEVGQSDISFFWSFEFSVVFLVTCLASVELENVTTLLYISRIGNLEELGFL